MRYFDLTTRLPHTVGFVLNYRPIAEPLAIRSSPRRYIDSLSARTYQPTVKAPPRVTRKLIKLIKGKLHV